MPKPKKPDDSSESMLFRNAPQSAKTLLKSAHSGARLKARKDWLVENTLTLNRPKGVNG